MINVSICSRSSLITSFTLTEASCCFYHCEEEDVKIICDFQMPADPVASYVDLRNLESRWADWNEMENRLVLNYLKSDIGRSVQSLPCQLARCLFEIKLWSRFVSSWVSNIGLNEPVCQIRSHLWRCNITHVVWYYLPQTCQLQDVIWSDWCILSLLI